MATVASCLLAVATACGGDEMAQATTTTSTTGASASSPELNQQLEQLQALIDDGAAEIEASTDKQELRKAVSNFTSALVDSEAQLRRVDVPPELEPEMSALLGSMSHVTGSLGGDALARLASSSVEETKQFIGAYARLADLQAAIAALQNSQ